MPHTGLSGPRSRNQKAQTRQSNNRRLHARSAEISDKKTCEPDLGRDLEGTKITLNECFDRWIQTAV
jgi:hypothetical protein